MVVNVSTLDEQTMEDKISQFAKNNLTSQIDTYPPSLVNTNPVTVENTQRLPAENIKDHIKLIIEELQKNKETEQTTQVQEMLRGIEQLKITQLEEQEQMKKKFDEMIEMQK